MRRILSRQEEDKKKKRNQFLVGGILALLMILSTLGYAFRNEFSGGTESITYNGFQFVKQGNLWFTSVGSLQFAFRYHPAETENISSNFFLSLNNYNGKSLYISSENYDAEIEIYRNLDQIVLRRQYACLENQTCEENFPIKTCIDNFIVIKEGNNSRITQQDNCVFIEGKKEELARMADKFLYKILGVS